PLRLELLLKAKSAVGLCRDCFDALEAMEPAIQTRLGESPCKPGSSPRALAVRRRRLLGARPPGAAVARRQGTGRASPDAGRRRSAAQRARGGAEASCRAARS